MKQLLVGLLFAAGVACAGEEIVLFNGKDFTGWTQRAGKHKFEIVDGAITGASVLKESNGFMCTDRTFRDFEFTCEAMLLDGNSGIQFRSACSDKPMTYELDGKTIKVAPGRVHGYQMEMAGGVKNPSGSIYDEGRRGRWICLNSNAVAQTAFKVKEWNKMKIRCEGSHIQTWINDVPIADFNDATTREGFIALQVHGWKTEVLMSRWRNLKIKEL